MTEMLNDLGLVGLSCPHVRATSGVLAVWAGAGLGVVFGGLALGIGSSLESSGSVETAGCTFDFAGERKKDAEV